MKKHLHLPCPQLGPTQQHQLMNSHSSSPPGHLGMAFATYSQSVFCSGYYCCIANYPETQKLTTTCILLYLMDFIVQEFRQCLPG